MAFVTFSSVCSAWRDGQHAQYELGSLMGFLRHILRLFVVMLFSALGTSMAFAAPMNTSDLSFYQAENTLLSKAYDVGFAPHAPPLAVSNVAVTGGFNVMQGGAFALHGLERAAALFDFDADYIAPDTGPIGFTRDTVDTAFSGMREGHAIRHLEGDLIPSTGSLQKRVFAFRDLARPILENPSHVAPWRVGTTSGRAFLGEVDGRTVAIVVATDGPRQGRVITAFVPDAKQLSLMTSR